MSKVKSAFFCQSCGYETPKWLGKCPGCSSWNSFVEELKQKKGSTAPFSKNSTDAKPVPLKDIKENIKQKTELQDKELNRVLGGGIVLGCYAKFGWNQLSKSEDQFDSHVLKWLQDLFQ